MLKGITIKPRRFTDERGFFTEVMRKDWKGLFGEDTIAQSNLSFTYPDVICAWDDPTLIPKIINRRNDTSRVGKPWDWNPPP